MAGKQKEVVAPLVIDKTAMVLTEIALELVGDIEDVRLVSRQLLTGLSREEASAKLEKLADSLTGFVPLVGFRRNMATLLKRWAEYRRHKTK